LRLRPTTFLILAALLCFSCTADAPLPIPGAGNEEQADDSLKIHVFGADTDRGLFDGARLAAIDKPVLGKSVEVVDAGPPDAFKLAALADRPDVIGALTIGGRDAIVQASPALNRYRMVVIELTDDLYESGQLEPPVFQFSIPYSWQAYRLARYFGPGDRAYRHVGLIRQADASGEIASRTLEEAASMRGLRFSEAVSGSAEPTEVGRVLAELQPGAPEAVVVEGTPELVQEVARQLATEGDRSYAGRARVGDGWRPQMGGFASLISSQATLVPGTVASAEYALALTPADSIQPVKQFLDSFTEEFEHEPVGHESVGFDAVMVLAEGAERAGRLDRAKIFEAISAFDRIRFARIPMSFGRTDWVAPERDHLGLWAVPFPERAGGERWLQLMRTFTSDLERTNIPEDDWPSFFDGTTPGGEAPFFHLAKRGIVSDRKDDLH